MKFTLFFLSVAASALATIAHNPAKREHHVPAGLQKRNETSNLVKRESFTGVATYYDVTPNAGACGEWMQPGQHVIALNSPQLNAYGGYVNGKPSSCYRSVTITGRGQSAQAVVMDECPTCGWGSIDLSEGLFTIFATTGDGVFDATWWFNEGANSGGGNNGGNNGGGQQQQTTTTTTQEYTPPPTSHQPDPTTSTTTTWTPSPAPTSSTSTSTSSSFTQQTIQEVPTTTPPQNLRAVKEAVVGLAGFINFAAALAH